LARLDRGHDQASGRVEGQREGTAGTSVTSGLLMLDASTTLGNNTSSSATIPMAGSILHRRKAT